MNSQPGKLSVLPGRVKTGGVTPVVYDGLFCGYTPLKPSFPWLVREALLIFRIEGCRTLSLAMQRPGSDENEFTPFCRTACLSEWAAARQV